MNYTKTEINGKVATLSLNNPAKLNALSKALVDEARIFLKECREKKIFVLLLKAEPNKSNVWSAGHDINELPAGPAGVL